MEADFIRRLKNTLPQQSPTHAGIGDDCSTMEFKGDSTPVITTDALVDQVHFDVKSQPLDLIGRKSLAVNLSDIAAMGATPVYALVSLIVPKIFTISDLQELFSGMITLAQETGTEIIGGDFNSHDGPLTVSITAIGAVSPSCIKYRFTTEVNDKIFVTGPLGRSLTGHHLTFSPRLIEGSVLATYPDVHAVTDITDGLLVDLDSVLTGNLGATLQAASIPCRQPTDDPEDDISHALYDGEDFELLFTVGSQADIRPLTEALPYDIYEIGVVNQSNLIQLELEDGNTETLVITGYEH